VTSRQVLAASKYIIFPLFYDYHSVYGQTFVL